MFGSVILAAESAGPSAVANPVEIILCAHFYSSIHMRMRGHHSCRECCDQICIIDWWDRLEGVVFGVWR